MAKEQIAGEVEIPKRDFGLHLSHSFVVISRTCLFLLLLHSSLLLFSFFIQMIILKFVLVKID